MIAFAQPHHPKKVMRLIAIQRNGLPLTQGVIYIEPSFLPVS